MRDATRKPVAPSSISVVIPAYNAASFIGEALDSILEQTRLPDEVIVIDDCSIDETSQIVSAREDKRIKVLRTPKNSGSAVARNLGIETASGELIAFLDADDIWLPHHCATVAGLLERHSEPALAFSRTEAFGDNSWTWPLYSEPDKPVQCFWECLRRTIVPQMNMIVRREALLAIGGYRPELRQTQDFDLCLRLSYKYPFVCSDQVTTRYRRHPSSVTARNPFKALNGEYVARFLFWKDNHASMDRETRQRLEETMRAIWLEQVRDAWDRCNLPALSFHLSKHEFVVGSEALYESWVRRRRFFRLKQVMEASPAVLRTLVHRAIRPLLN